MAKYRLHGALSLIVLLLGAVAPAWAVKVRFTDESYQETPSRWLIQTGTFKAQQNAQKQVENLKRRGYQSAEVVWDEGKYHVFLSPQKNHANTLLREIKKSFPDAYLRADFRRKKGKVRIVGY